MSNTTMRNIEEIKTLRVRLFTLNQVPGGLGDYGSDEYIVGALNAIDMVLSEGFTDLLSAIETIESNLKHGVK